jgi:hypothetical protein
VGNTRRLNLFPRLLGHRSRILTKARQEVETVGSSLAQLYGGQLLDERARPQGTKRQTVQYRPYTRPAYAISMIPEGQGGGRSSFGIPSNEAIQTCRDDLLVRNPLRVFFIQEMWNRSLGWTRENIWESLRIKWERETTGIRALDRGCRMASQEVSATWPCAL